MSKLRSIDGHRILARDDAATVEETFLNAVRIGTPVRGANLAGANLAGANLSKTNLEGADLTGVNLEGAILEGAILAGAYLRGANLSKTNLAWANLADANLTDANLTGADLTGANLEGADLRRTTLPGTILPDGRALDGYVEWLREWLPVAHKPLESFRSHWQCHTWSNCPMAWRYGVDRPDDVPDTDQDTVQQFVTLFDAKLLPEELVFGG